MPNIPFVVKVVCRGTAQQPHQQRRLARYQRVEDGWERADRHGTDIFVSAGPKGIQMEARPVFACPCGRRVRIDPDKLQHLLETANGKPITV
ncbi:hypothetical protein Q9S36_03080 [Microbacterium sp. ARD31]|uniref:hypothetical protein n=1 Tax=Microbacterium sp. ARD31 TaxID=2962576 RepID=UPI002882BEF3|nr:hypothetical protein [Microbacterium sp. ARD31]MDT0179191.1 hypothetical protein [Microbacterium sp. ARD31]